MKYFKREEFACKYFLYHIGLKDMGVGEGYIGVTNNPEKRFSRHLLDLKKGIHCNPHLQRAYSKYGNLIFSVKVVGDKEYICELEKLLRPEKFIGYNIVGGGLLPPSNKGLIMSEEQKEKISKANKGKKSTEEHKRRAVNTRMFNGSYKKGIENKNSKEVIQYTLQNEEIFRYPSTRSVHETLGYSQGNIASVCRGERRQAYGYFWRYANG